MRKAIAKVCEGCLNRHKTWLKIYSFYYYLVGDFGLATSSLAAVDPSDVSPHAVTLEADMTLGTVPFKLGSSLS